MGHSIPRQFRFGRKVQLPHDFGSMEFNCFGGHMEQCPYGQKTRNRCFSRIYLKASARPSHLFLPSPLPDTPHQEERYHQGKGNGQLMPLASQEAVGTTSIRSRERLGGLLEYYSREAA